VVLYVVAFSLGIEVGDSDRKILAYYANSGHRTKQIVAFFPIAGATLALVVFATRAAEPDRKGGVASSPEIGARPS
jgi:hypothetical protein